MTSRTGPLRALALRSLDAPARLAPVVGELFEPLIALGSLPRRTANLLAGAGVGSGSRVIDLGCGKGAVAVELARRTGAQVTGIDALPEFIHAAQRHAQSRGVADLCTFRAGDLRRARPPSRRFHAGVMTGVAPILEAAPRLRRWVRPGGVYLIDDAFVEAVVRARRPELAGLPTRAEVATAIESLGDRVERLIVPTRREVRRQNAVLYRRLLAQGRSLRRRRPALARPIDEFLRRQRDANRLLAGDMRPGLWLIRRGR